MRTLLIIAMLTSTLMVPAQIVITGPIHRADTTTITVWSDGECVLTQRVHDGVYALILGNKPHYTISFENLGLRKYATLITHGMGDETIRLPVHFNILSNVLITKEKTSLFGRRVKRHSPITLRFYGHHGYREKF